MACKNSVLLGYDDEIITDKHASVVNYMTNKIGGKPDYPPSVHLENPVCPLCQLPRLLILQIYAPLDNSTYHRTLYLFACINPNCWNHSESWDCVRVQTTDQLGETSHEPQSNFKCTSFNVTDWFHDADDWGDANSNGNEENGNFVGNFEKISDEDDESCSTEESLRAAFGNMIVDDRNANIEVVSGAQGAVAETYHSSPISAEIEGDEGEIVTIDTPTIPQRDLHSLLQEVPPLPQEIQRHTDKLINLQFVPHFVSVWEEQISSSNISDHHVRELLTEYQQKNQDEFKETSKNSNNQKINDNQGDTVSEKYEKSLPAHGDRMFHHFITRIQMNPGQILRYGRDVEEPLLVYPLMEVPKNCENCGGKRIFEFQILPTLIQKLRLPTDPKNCARLEFGTVLIFTCQKSCWTTGTTYVREEVILQVERY
ncbi:programmed cell death protein 2-like [Agrilus planipennis]|uniref:Programmed cell death protein 2-like n=1 Tax=Agrilus planipennis TaxID=224129 RepID=A0A1W4XGE5_AGRPL|nr:programmed cell death protein 2-like [Agrilus planipennis]